MRRRLPSRIAGYVGRKIAGAASAVSGSRPVRWFLRLRPVAFLVRVLTAVWLFAANRVWWPLKRLVRRVRKYLGRAEVWYYAVAWGLCAFLAYALLQETMLMALILGLMTAAVYVAIALRSPLAAMMIWLVASPFLTMYIAVKPLPGMPVITGDRYCLIVLLGVYLLQWKRGREETPNKSLHWAMIVFIGAMMISATQAEYPRRAAQSVLDTYAAPFFVYLFARRWITNHKHLALAFAALVFIGVYFSLIGIPEHFTKTLVFAGRRAAWLEEELGTVRVQGPAESPSEFGLVVLLASLLALVGMAHASKNTRRLLYWGILGLTVMAVALTLRRSVYVSAALVFPLMLFAGRLTRRRTALILALAAVAGLVFWRPLARSPVFQSRIRDVVPIYNRAVVYATSWEIVKAHPWFGIGLERYPEVSREYIKGYGDILPFYGKNVKTTHNAYLRIAVEGGFAALIPYLAVLLFMITTAVRARRGARGSGWLGPDGVFVFIAFTVGMLQDALTDDIFWFSRYLTSIWFFTLGAIVGAHLRRPQDSPEVDPVPEASPGRRGVLTSGRSG